VSAHYNLKMLLHSLQPGAAVTALEAWAASIQWAEADAQALPSLGCFSQQGAVRL